MRRYKRLYLHSANTIKLMFMFMFIFVVTVSMSIAVVILVPRYRIIIIRGAIHSRKKSWRLANHYPRCRPARC